MIELAFLPPDLRRIDEASAEVVACGLWREERPLGALAGLLDWRLAGRLSRLAQHGFLAGEPGEILLLPGRPRLPFDKLLAFGMGSRAAFGDATFRQVTGRVLEALSGMSVKKAVFELPGRGDGAIEPERAAGILFDLVDASEEEERDRFRDGLVIVEEPDAQRRIEKHAQERRRTSLRASGGV